MKLNAIAITIYIIICAGFFVGGCMYGSRGGLPANTSRVETNFVTVQIGVSNATETAGRISKQLGNTEKLINRTITEQSNVTSGIEFAIDSADRLDRLIEKAERILEE